MIQSPLIANRKSVRAFSSKSVEPEKVRAMLESARWAPSCANNQPWRYILVDRKASSRPALEEALAKGNAWAKAAPLLVVVAGRAEDDCLANDVKYVYYDCGMSVMQFVLEAENQGLRAHQMAGWDGEKVSSALAIPPDYQPIVVFAVGCEGRLEDLEPAVQEKERKPRTRNELSEIAFQGTWGKPLS
jgi:nitroreductase